MSDEIASENHKSRTVQTKQGIWRTYDGADGLPGGYYALYRTDMDTSGLGLGMVFVVTMG